MPAITPIPKFKPGEVIGSLTVLRILKYECRGLCRPYYWYAAACTCGGVAEYNQSQLTRRHDCDKCQNQRIAKTLAANRKEARAKNAPAPVIVLGLPNFATMRLR